MELREPSAKYLVRSAFQQTELGLLPIDWIVVPLREVASRVTDGEHQTPARSAAGYYLLSARNIQNGHIDLSNVDYVPESEYLRIRQRCNPEAGDVLISCSGSIGRVATVPAGFECVMVRSAALVKPSAKRVAGSFLQFFLQSSVAQNQIFASLNQGAQANLFLNHIEALLVAVPPRRAEQVAIAEALSDADALIESLEQLLAKKRRVKQGAMQELLTGKKRLPGYSGEWEVRRLGDVFSISAGKSKSAFIVDGGRYWIVDMGSVSTDGRLIASKATNYFGDFLCVGDLVMPKDDIGGGGIIGKVGYIDSDGTYVLGDHVYRLTAYLGSPLFFSYVINGFRTNTALRKKVIGSAQLGLGRKSVNEQRVPFPSVEEQTAIATILSDMDTELAALEAKLSKARQIKQAMMQVLLTGQIRLV